MSESPHAVHLEIERSYDVPAGVTPPDLGDLADVTGVDVEPTRHLEAVYIDTAELDLTRARTTLRRRTGGKDDGWHLKLPASGDARRELQAPLEDSLPVALEAAVENITTAPLLPLVKVENDRTTHLLRGADGAVLAELCEDRVRTTGLRSGVPDQQWAEWEVELVTADEAFLDAVEARLVAVGATRLQLASKLVRALGPVAPQG